MNVLVIDHQPLFAQSVAAALGRDPALSAHAVSSLSDLAGAVGSAGPAVVLLSLEFPQREAFPAIRRIRSAAPSVQVIALAARGGAVDRALAVEAGAAVCVSTSTPLSEIIDLVHRAAAGEELMSGGERDQLLALLRDSREQRTSERQRVNRLTPRQAEILQLIADGLTPVQIADRLGLSPLTLRTHVQNILTRLGVHTKLEAVALAVRHGRIAIRG